MDATLRLFLIRHGETSWSISGQHTGRSDLPLTAHGEQMACALAPVLDDVQFSRVLTSPWLRGAQYLRVGRSRQRRRNRGGPGRMGLRRL